jgi:hypothetical protein
MIGCHHASPTDLLGSNSASVGTFHPLAKAGKNLTSGGQGNQVHSQKTHWTLAAKSLKSTRTMKSGTLTTILHGALALSLVLSVVFCIQFIFLTREFRGLNSQLVVVNAYRSTVQALANDCMEYSKKNPAIDPVLKSVGLK